MGSSNGSRSHLSLFPTDPRGHIASSRRIPHRTTPDDLHPLLATVTQPTSNRTLGLANSWDTGDVDEIVIESCHSTWVIDMQNSRFRRIVKGSNHRTSPASTEWQPCYGVEIDPLSESFVGLLNPEGTRLLRSWRHVEHCAQCGGEATSELSLRDLRSAVRG
jgi:hypothetical protein